MHGDCHDLAAVGWKVHAQSVAGFARLPMTTQARHHDEVFQGIKHLTQTEQRLTECAIEPALAIAGR